MHSFHHSRGRILFETACALTISGSCVAAWMDLGVPAFLPVAAVSALYGLVHLFDMRGRKPAVAFAAPAVELEAESQGELLAYTEEPSPAPVVELVEKAAPAPAPEPKPKKRRTAKKPKPVVEVEPVAEIDPVTEIAPVADPEPVVEVEPVAEAELPESEAYDEPEEHAPVTPLFEPEPFVRQQQRAVFGRKAS